MLKTSARLCNAFPIFWYSLGNAERGKRMGKRGKQKKNPTRVIETRSAVFPNLDRSKSQKQLGFTFPLVKHSQFLTPPLLHTFQDGIKQLQSGFLKATNSWGNSLWLLWKEKKNEISWHSYLSSPIQTVRFFFPPLHEQTVLLREVGGKCCSDGEEISLIF